jgi:hypothetical protein
MFGPNTCTARAAGAGCTLSILGCASANAGTGEPVAAIAATAAERTAVFQIVIAGFLSISDVLMLVKRPRPQKG